MPDFAETSWKIKFFSLATASPSAVVTWRFSFKSSLFPTRQKIASSLFKSLTSFNQ